MSEIKVGDVVQLRSGGPKMTVQKTDGNDIYCQWFDEKNKLQFGKFLAEVLKPA